VILSVSVVVLLAVAVAVLCRWAGLRAWHAVVCVLLGFYLASSPLAPAIATATGQLARLLTGH
jgi:hypothetical protein